MTILSFAVLLLGISSITSQIVLIRESLITFYGNELSIGIILGNWLFWTSMGSLLGTYIVKKVKRYLSIISISQIIFSFLLILTIFLLRGVRLFIPVVSGEILGIIPIWLYSFIFLSGICIINGFLFVLLCTTYKHLFTSKTKEESIANTYTIESFGSAIGGLFCSFLLIRYFNSIVIIWILVMLNLIIAGILWKEKHKWFIFIGCFIVFVLGITGSLKLINHSTRQWNWDKALLLDSEDSIYGNVTVTKYDSTYNMYENGLLAFSCPDELSSEEITHLTLMQNPDPKNILIIGNGAGGVISECLKYESIESIDYVEIDPLIIQLAKGYLPSEGLDNPKVNIHNLDGRTFLNKVKNKYDAILINLPDPYTAQINRFYTLEFYELCAKHLNENGVISLGVTSSENYISSELGDFLRCIYYTLKKVFPNIITIPGGYCRFIASKSGDYLTDDYKKLDERLNVSTKYIKDYYLKYNLSPERLKYIHKELLTNKPVRINKDFYPACYYYGITFWSTYFNNTFKNVFEFVSKIKPWHFILLFLMALIWPKMKKGSYVLFPIATSGFSEISFQIVTLLAFQTIYGFVYYKLGIILTSFMIGIGLGSWTVNKIMPNIKKEYELFRSTQIAIILYPLLLPLIFYFLSSNAKFAFVGENIILPYIPIVAGFIGGFQFPLGNKIYLSKIKETSYSAGITYGLDLFGACVGVFLISAFILPVLGITQTCFITAIINLSGLIIIMKNRR